MQDEPDRELLWRFTQGDRDAFEELFRQFEREVYRWILRIVRDPASAEDAVIETFWRAYRGRARFDFSRSFGPWMRRIATNCAIDQLNAARRHRWFQPDDVGRGPGSTLAKRARLGDIAVGGGPADPDLANHIRHAFVALPPKLRVVATLALIEELPLADVADALDIPIGTVKSRLFRATRELRTGLTRLGIQI